MEKVIAFFGGRKAIFTGIIIAVGTIVELKTERGISSNFVALLLGAAGLFTAGNSASKFIYGKFNSEGAVAPEGETESGTAGLAEVQELHSKIDQIQEQLAGTSTLLESVTLSTGNTQKLIVAALQGKVS